MRIAAETSLSPGWLLIAFPVVLYPAYLLLEVLFGRGLAAATDFAGDWETGTLLGWSVGLGYTAMVGTYVARGTFRDLDALRPVLIGGDTKFRELQKQITGFDNRRLWIGGLAWGACFCLAAELAAGRWSGFLAGEWSLRAICTVATGFASWVVFGRLAVYVIDSARLYSRIGEEQVRVDLLDLAPVSPLTRHGLRVVLFLVIGGASWAVLEAFGPARQPTSATMILLFVLVCYVALATVIFSFPVRGLRRQIRARKAEKLGQLREEIRDHEKRMAGSGTEAAEAGAKLSGLLAYKHEIESVREWPFDAPTLTRFFLYVAIPLGSWIGGALVERLLGAALD